MLKRGFKENATDECVLFSATYLPPLRLINILLYPNIIPTKIAQDVLKPLVALTSAGDVGIHGVFTDGKFFLIFWR